ncbi:MAG: CopG family ribbon-helix-helix protein [Kiloniellaceae bacterium]
MAQVTFTFRVDDDLKSAFAETAKAQDRTAAQLLRVLMREAVRRQQEAREHDAWFRGEVEQGMREADDPAVRRISHEDVRSNWRRQHAKLLKRAGGKTA